MKKSIFIGALALITLAACQNETNKLADQPKELAKNSVEYSRSEGETGEEAVLNAVNEVSESNRLPGGGAVIHCHTDYLSSEGSACVSNGGYIFSVSWTSTQLNSNGTFQFLPEPIYTATQVSSCGC